MPQALLSSATSIPCCSGRYNTGMLYHRICCQQLSTQDKASINACSLSLEREPATGPLVLSSTTYVLCWLSMKKL